MLQKQLKKMGKSIVVFMSYAVTNEQHFIFIYLVNITSDHGDENTHLPPPIYMYVTLILWSDHVDENTHLPLPIYMYITLILWTDHIDEYTHLPSPINFVIII